MFLLRKIQSVIYLQFILSSQYFDVLSIYSKTLSMKRLDQFFSTKPIISPPANISQISYCFNPIILTSRIGPLFNEDINSPRMKPKQAVTARRCIPIQLPGTLLSCYYPFKSTLSFQNHRTPHNGDSFDCGPWTEVEQNVIQLMAWFGQQIKSEMSRI